MLCFTSPDIFVTLFIKSKLMVEHGDLAFLSLFLIMIQMLSGAMATSKGYFLLFCCQQMHHTAKKLKSLQLFSHGIL